MKREELAEIFRQPEYLKDKGYWSIWDSFEIKEKLDVLETDINLNRLLARLERFKFIKKQEDFYKLNVERLFDH